MAAKKLSTVSLADLVKRVPKNQMKQFEKFRDKTLEYHRRVNQLPAKLPFIDWDYYRSNVRQEYVNMVSQFQCDYEELDCTFNMRHELNDFSKYYEELEKLTEKVKEEVRQYIEESNSRIQCYEAELKRLRSLVPYEEMTMEQFVTEREDLAEFIPRQGKALFWPHDPSEQRVGPASPDFDQNLTKNVKGKGEVKT
ncbi:ATP synthase subunit d, mitochondrial isoform X1 [Stomoxys calcitrans]|uniref:ATP synthase subunit d, mitochondrial isoform X1 n=1 Tax=Stomoxys calcitrans TaxID=35570 RepID=UPI0027E2C124|nr:ATP synthase subunit d, mitochondrial isoform X1 [Stomoxys calcitrans]